ncbi:hypothetical protein F5X68DRAFT_185822 [Plectosphaerella plurivora]|uniref:Uncharacterized protein n=1 Tax=Plectosphaerella plurivora TaxID=936078 RepID=A0A9P8VLS8_9PEZI|nr:hypothetical protein F5X68DRAFT_185822 [Plectosphaerella plurivora]
MPEKEERTFFLYSDGYSSQELGLGHLVFGNFAKPTKGRQCSMEPLRRITLKNPQKFLTERVLSADSTRKTVQEWLSVSTNEYALRTLTPLGWWPKIWMLTGFYELEDCASFSWSKSDVSAEAGVAAEVMALLNIPLGADASIHRAKGRGLKQDRPGKTIWAAEYQLVGAKFMRVPSAERDRPATTPLQLPLKLRAVYSATDSGWRASGSGVTQKEAEKEANNMAVLGLADEVSSAQGDISEREDEFWELFDEVEEDWQDGDVVDE